MFYYDFREDQKKDPCGLLPSVLVELTHTLASSPNSTRSTKMVPAMADLSGVHRNY